MSVSQITHQIVNIGMRLFTVHWKKMWLLLLLMKMIDVLLLQHLMCIVLLCILMMDLVVLLLLQKLRQCILSLLSVMLNYKISIKFKEKRKNRNIESLPSWGGCASIFICFPSKLARISCSVGALFITECGLVVVSCTWASSLLKTVIPSSELRSLLENFPLKN